MLLALVGETVSSRSDRNVNIAQGTFQLALRPPTEVVANVGEQ